MVFMSMAWLISFGVIVEVVVVMIVEVLSCNSSSPVMAVLVFAIAYYP